MGNEFNRQLNLYKPTDDAHRSVDGWLDIKGITLADSDGTLSETFQVGRATGSNAVRGILQIKLPTFPYHDANSEITGCKVHIFCGALQNDFVEKISVYKITKAVRMSNVSWDYYSNTNSEELEWTTAGATGADDIELTSNYGHGANGVIDKVTAPAAASWMTLDLQGLVNTGDIQWGMDAPTRYVYLLVKAVESEALHRAYFEGDEHVETSPIATTFAMTNAASVVTVDGEHIPSDTTILVDDIDGGAGPVQIGDIIAVTDISPDTTQTWDTMEFMKVTGIDTGTNILTVERGYDGTTPRTILNNSYLSRYANASAYIEVLYKNDYPTAPIIEVVPQDNGIDATVRILNNVADKDLTGFITAWNTTLSSLAATGSNNTTVITETSNFDNTNTLHFAANLLNTANTNYYVAIYSTDNEVDNPTTAHGAVASNILTVSRPTVSTAVIYDDSALSSALGSDGSTNADIGEELYLKVVASSKIKKVYVNWDSGVSDEDDDYIEYILENIAAASSDGIQISHKYPDTGLHNVKVQVENAAGFRSGTTAAKGTAITGHDPNITTSNPVAKISASRSKVLSSIYPDQTTTLVLSGAHSYAVGSDQKIAEYRFSYDAHASTSATAHDTICTAHATSNDNTVFERASSILHVKNITDKDVMDGGGTTFKVYGLASVDVDGANIIDTDPGFSHYIWTSATVRPDSAGASNDYGSATSEFFKTVEIVVGTVSVDADDACDRYVLSANSSYDSYTNIVEGGTYGSGDLTLTVTDGSVFSVGDEIKIESEILLISAISSDNLTVHRGYQGTSAASHADGTDIYFTNRKVNKELRLKDTNASPVVGAGIGRWSGYAFYKGNNGSGTVFTASNNSIKIANSISTATGGTSVNWFNQGFYIGDTIKIGNTTNNGTNTSPLTATIIDIGQTSAANDTIFVDVDLTDETVQGVVIRTDHALKPVPAAIYHPTDIDHVTFTLGVNDEVDLMTAGTTTGAEDSVKVMVSSPNTLNLDTELDDGNIAISSIDLSRSGGMTASMPLGVRRYPVAGVRTSMGNPILSCKIRMLNDRGFTKIFALLEGGVYDYVFLDTKKVDSPTTTFKSFKMHLISGRVNKTPDMAGQYTASLQFAVVGEEEA